MAPSPTTAPSTSASTELHLRSEVWGGTHQGLVRQVNEDQFLVALLPKAMRIEQCMFAAPTELAADERQLWLVADGMGGHAGGETASKLGTETIEDFTLHVLKWFFSSAWSGKVGAAA